jgi:hypothetical protein
MNHDSTEKIEERIRRALQRKPYDPMPFQDEWLNREPAHIVAVLPAGISSPARFSGKSVVAAILSTAALLFIALSAFLLIPKEDPSRSDSPAIALYKKGEVTVNRNHQTLKLNPGFQLLRNDQIIVAREGRLDLRMPDSSLIRIQGEAEIRLLSLNQKIRLEQKKGTTFHSVVPSTVAERVDYTIQSPTAIASVRGTRFVVQTDDTGTIVRVTEGIVAAGAAGTDEARTIELKEEEEVEIRADIKKIEKKHANTADDLVVFTELDRQRKVWNPEVTKQIEGMHATSDEGQIEKIYRRPLEILYMTDGRVLKGVVASQVDRTLILHTTEGVIAVPIEELKEVRFQQE